MSAARMKPAAALALFAALLATGCSDAFDPFVESDETFALYGFLDARRDTQYVRVQPIAERDTTRIVDARVTSTARATGEQIVWQDTLIRLDDGTTGTAFFAPFRPRPGATYRLEAAPPAEPNAVSAAEVTVPAEPSLLVAEPTVIGGLVSQALTLTSAVAPQRVRVTYTVRRPAGGEPVGFSFDYPARSAPSGAGFDILINLLRDAGTIQSVLGIAPDDPERPALLSLRLDYDLIVVQQAVVTGGPGAVGSAAAFVGEWTLAPEVVEALGFVDAQGGA